MDECKQCDYYIKEIDKLEAYIKHYEEEYDPTPYCSGCKAKSAKNCKCGPIADND